MKAQIVRGRADVNLLTARDAEYNFVETDEQRVAAVDKLIRDRTRAFGRLVAVLVHSSFTSTATSSVLFRVH
jgi:hypothetical protein